MELSFDAKLEKIVSEVKKDESMPTTKFTIEAETLFVDVGKLAGMLGKGVTVVLRSQQTDFFDKVERKPRAVVDI